MHILLRYIRALYSLFHLCAGCVKLKIYQCQYRNTNIHWGKKIQAHGNFIMRIKGNAHLGNEIVFTNRTRFNFVGITKPCSIYVGTHGSLLIDSNSGFSGVSIVCLYQINIGKYCNFGGNVCIWDTDFHPLDYLDRRVHDESKIISKSIVIGDDVFVGANSIILKGVTIGDRSIIGAGSVVTRDIPADEIWAGNPAKFIRKV